MEKTIFLCFCFLLALPASASNEKLPLIPNLHHSVKQGQLENGLRYLIKPISPQTGQASEVELRLLINSGSMDEAKDERGIAHLIEHMAFRQTKHFPEGEVKGFFNSNGMRWGNDSNGFTSYEHTGYNMKVTAKSLDRSLQLMADWVNGEIVFDETTLNTERQVVLDEKRLRAENFAQWQSYFDVLIPNAPHANQPPIGFEEYIKGLPKERIEALYRRLYEPQKVTLVIAGDVPVDIEQRISALFAKRPQGDGQSQHASLALTPRVRMYRGTPAPWPQTEFAVSWNFLQQPITDAAQIQLQFLALEALQQRLQKLAANNKFPLSSTQWVDWSGTIGRERYLTLYASVKEEKIDDGLKALYREIRRARESGFSEAEITDAKTSYERIAKGLPVNNENWADSLMGVAKMGVTSLYTAEQAAIFDPAKIDAKAVNAAWQQLVRAPDQIAMVMHPVSAYATNLNYWTDEHLGRMMASVDAETLKKIELADIKPLILVEPPRGKIAKTQQEQGVTVWTLSNGAQVLIRAQRQADERIGVDGSFSGGALALPEDWQFASVVLPLYMNLSGMGELNAAELGLATRSEELNLFASFDVGQHGFSGVAANRSFTPMMQLIYLALAKPRSDDLAREAAVSQASENYWQQRGGPGASQNLYRSAWPFRTWTSTSDFSITTEKLDQLRKQFYGDPAQLRLVLTGIADMAQAKDLVERYIASIPAASPSPVKLVAPKITAEDPELTTRTLSERIKASVNKYSSRAGIGWSVVLNDVEVNTQSAFMAEALVDLAKQRFLTAIRDQAGDSYSVGGWYEISPSYGPVLHLINSADADTCGDSIKIAAQELKKLSQLPISDKELKAMRELMQKGLNDGPMYPQAYAHSQMFHWVNNTNFSWVHPNPEHILSREKVDAAARAWFAPEKWIVAVDYCKVLPDLTVLDQTQTASAQ